MDSRVLCERLAEIGEGVLESPSAIELRQSQGDFTRTAGSIERLISTLEDYRSIASDEQDAVWSGAVLNNGKEPYIALRMSRHFVNDPAQVLGLELDFVYLDGSREEKLGEFLAKEAFPVWYDSLRTGLLMIPYLATGNARYVNHISEGDFRKMLSYLANTDSIRFRVEADSVPSDLLFAAMQAVRNSCQHGYKGSGPVDVSLKEFSGWYQLTVRDVGRGIEKERLTEIIHPGEGRIGSGLLIMRQVAEHRRGKVYIHSETDGQGVWSVTSERSTPLLHYERASKGTVVKCTLPKAFSASRQRSPRYHCPAARS